MRRTSILAVFVLLLNALWACGPESTEPVAAAPEQAPEAKPAPAAEPVPAAEKAPVAKKSATTKKQAAKKAGDSEKDFVPLFDGKSLAGWQGRTEDYEAVDGILVCKAGAHGSLYTDREYSDFVLRLEYRLGPAGNNGIGIRAAVSDQAPATTGMEIQILDDNDPQYKDLKPMQFTGSIYGAVAAERGQTKPAGEWNAMEIRAKGPNIRVKLNGKQILKADMDKVGPKQIHNLDLAGLHNKTGYIAICGHTDRVEFRNIRIKELK